MCTGTVAQCIIDRGNVNFNFQPEITGFPNVVATAPACQQQCMSQPTCVSGLWLSGSVQHGRCYLTAGLSPVPRHDFCGAKPGQTCVGFVRRNASDLVGAAGSPSCTAQLLPARATNLKVFGVNEDWAGASWPAGLLELKLIAAIRSLGVGSLRFPAGTASQAFDLRTGEFVSDDRIVGVFGSTSSLLAQARNRAVGGPGVLSLANMSALLAAVNATPCWDLNIASLNSSEIEDTVRVLRGTAAGAEFVEMGNELYSGFGDPSRPYGRQFPAVSDYLQRIAPAVASMEDSAGALKSNWAVPVAPAPLLAGKRDPGNDETDWNDGMVANASILSPDTAGAFTAVTAHLYIPSANLSYMDCLARHPEALWPSVLGAFPDAAIERTLNSTRSEGLKGTPKLWLTETNMGGGSASRSLEPNTSAVERFTTLAFVAPVSALSKAGFLLSAVSRPEVAIMHHHSLLWDPSGDVADVALWSRDPFGMLWTKEKSCGASKSSCGHWPFSDDVPRIASTAHVFARIAGVARTSRSVHPVGISDGAPLGATILGEPAHALQAAAFSTAEAADGGDHHTDASSWHDGTVTMCVVVLNRGVDAVGAHVSLPPASNDTSDDIKPWTHATAVALDASKRECEGNGHSCWVPIPDESTPAESWTGPLPVSNLTVRVQGGGSTGVSLVVPPLSISFVRLLPTGGGESTSTLHC
jgi:hypothetical protein